VIARTCAVIAPGGRLLSLACQPPLTVRQVRSERADTCALCLVGTAAGPLAGDELALSLQLVAGAHASLQAAGASIAQGRGSGAPARLSIEATLGAGARLSAAPGTLVVCEGGRVDVAVTVNLGTGAVLEWRELIVLGRTHDRPGRASLTWNVTRDAQPVLRQRVDLADERLARWPGTSGGHRVIASALLVDPERTARTVVASPTAVAQRVDGQTVLATVLADDAADAGTQLEELCARVRG